MYDYPELSLAREEMLTKSPLYHPTAFWDEASSNIERELREHGIENFRRLPSSLNFFVPTYGSPGNSITATQEERIRAALPGAPRKAQQCLQQFLSGELSALSDYRVLLAADNPDILPSLHVFSEITFGSPTEQFEFEGRRFSRSSLNYLLGLAMLKKYLGMETIRTVLEVGGGFGTLGEILAHSGLEGWRYIDIDIPPTSFVAEHYLRAAIGTERVTGYAATRGLHEIDLEGLPNASVLCSWQIENLRGRIDLFVNFISFQEMEPPVVANYLRHVDRLESRWVLLRNMREGKQMRSGPGSIGVEVPIKSDDYIDFLHGYELVDRNVTPFGFRTADGYHSELLLLRRR
jgi:putative sugar O-methyltransferase